MFAEVKIRNSPIRSSKGLSLVETSIELPRDDRTIVCLGDNSLRRCRVKSRETVRIAGGGTFTIDGCSLEAIGIGNDHADCIQCYSPGDIGKLHIKNTTIRAYRTSDVTPPQIGSQGLFVADNWTGTVICENVVFWGAGNYACHIFPDTGGDWPFTCNVDGSALRKNSENQHNGLTSFFGPSDVRELAWFETDLEITGG